MLPQLLANTIKDHVARWASSVARIIHCSALRQLAPTGGMTVPAQPACVKSEGQSKGKAEG
jgi:hypothetical protein